MTDGRLREIALFAGAGGGLLASELLGWRTVAAVEREPYCQRVLCARGAYMADADGGRREKQRESDREPEHEGAPGSLPDRCGRAFPLFDDVRTFDATRWRGRVDVVSGGFPCQPFSHAGSRRGRDDERNLWPDTLRVLVDSGAPLGFLENVVGLISVHRGDYFGTILGGLADAGFDAEWCRLGADDLGAPHRRKRLWILAYKPDVRLRAGARGDLGIVRGGWWDRDPADVGYATGGRLEGRGDDARGGQPRPVEASGQGSTQPALGGLADGLADWLGDDRPSAGVDLRRVAQGVPDRPARLRALGNGQVPIVAAAAFGILARRAGILAHG